MKQVRFKNNYYHGKTIYNVYKIFYSSYEDRMTLSVASTWYCIEQPVRDTNWFLKQNFEDYNKLRCNDIETS
jgi:hypothetical protein